MTDRIGNKHFASNHTSDDFRVLNINVLPRTDCSGRININMDIVLHNGVTSIQLKKVPLFLETAFQKIIKNGMNTDGLFRKEGSALRLGRPEVCKIYEGAIDIPSDFSVIDTCTMVKRYLRDLQPPLIDSNVFRERILRLAAKVKATGKYELDHATIADLFFNSNPQLSDASLGTMGYVMRQLNIIASRSDSHRMTVDNLALVLVGCVFNDAMNVTGISESMRKRQQKRPPVRLKTTETMMSNLKDDMKLPTEAVKILIINAKYIGIPLKYYIASGLNVHARSNSALPVLRQNAEPSTSTSSSSGEFRKHRHVITNKAASAKRDSDSSSITTTNTVKSSVTQSSWANKNDRLEVGKKRRSSSFLPNLRDIRDKMFMRKNRSPSAMGAGISSTEKLARSVARQRAYAGEGGSAEKSASKKSNTDDEDTLTDVFETPAKKDNESLKSYSSGRKSRSQTSKSKNPNSRHRQSWSRSEKSINDSTDKTMDFGSSSAIDIKLLQQHSGQRSPRSIRSRKARAEMSVDMFISPEKSAMLGKTKKPLTERCNVVTPPLPPPPPPAPPLPASFIEAANQHFRHHRNARPGRRRFTEPINSGVPFQRRKEISRRKTFAEKGIDEKENVAEADGPSEEFASTSSVDSVNVHDDSLLEMMCEYSRQRRAGLARTKGKPATESLIGLNGSLAHAEGERAVDATIRHRSNEDQQHKQKQRRTETPPSSTLPRTIVDERKMTPKNIDFAIGVTPRNGQAWVGTTQLVISSPQPAKKSAGSIDCTTPKRFSMSPSPRHLVQMNNSPATFVTTERSSPMVTPKAPRTPRTPRTTSIQSKAQSVATMTPMREMKKSPTSTISGSKQRPSLELLETSSSSSSSQRDSRLAPKPIIDDSLAFKCPAMPGISKAKAKSAKPLASGPRTMSMGALVRHSDIGPQTVHQLDTAAAVTAPKMLYTTGRSNSVNPPPQESFPAGKQTSRGSVVDDSLCFGQFNDLLKNSSASEMNLLAVPSDIGEMRPSVALIRNQQSGLVRSRVNHFQEIAQSTVGASDTFFSGRLSAMSTRTSVGDMGTDSTLSTSARPSFGSVCSSAKK